MLLTLPLVLASSSGIVASGQTFSLNDKIVTVSSVQDEKLFDTQLLAQNQPSCTNAQPGSTMQPPQPLQMPAPNDNMSGPPSTDNLNQPSNNTFNQPSPNVFNQPSGAGNLSAGQGALTAQNSIAAAMNVGGYLDPAAPVTTFRLRYDDAINNRFPDRGEYFYAKCGCFRDPALAPGPANDQRAKGPQGINNSVDSQDVRSYLEYAFNPKISVFAELPFRFLNFNSSPIPAGSTQTNLGSEAGLSDMNVGFKYAFVAEQDRYFTFQLRAYLPTGDSYNGMGTGHYSLEPSLLYYRRLSDRWLLQGQFSEFTPVSVTGFASNVLQYGGGLGYIAYQGPNATVVPTFEMVGWTFLGGQKFSPSTGLESASGDTIINAKPGVRIGFGNSPGPMMMQQQSVYAGFGIPVTNDQFYSNLFRVEYRVLF